MIVKRIGLGLFSLLAISLLITVGVEALSGDVCTAMLGIMASDETTAACHAKLNLDRPIWVRYLEWLFHFIQGDMGNSLANERTVAELVSARIGNTIFLATCAALIAIPLGILLGVIAALYRGTAFDRGISITTLSAISVPDFFVAYILMAIFAVSFSVFPAISNVSDHMGIFERVYVSSLPIITLTLITIASMMRMTRASIVNLLASPYIEMAKLKGIKPFRVIVKHALPNAWAPIIQVSILNLAYMVVGVVIIEVVFVYPGLGALMVDSVALRNMTVVQATAMIFASAYVLLNLLADVLSIVANPRLRHRR